MDRRLAALGIAISAAAFPTQAGHIIITLPAPSIYIAVGTLGATIDTVTFPLGAQPLGTPVPQLELPVLIEVAYRRGGGGTPNQTVITMTPSPATGLTDGTFSVPWTHFSWTSSNTAGGTGLPSGTFTGAPNQLLRTFNTPPNQTGRREASFTYTYDNAVAFPGGTYTGRVTFTATTP
jgi:hypothetical protein